MRSVLFVALLVAIAPFAPAQDRPEGQATKPGKLEQDPAAMKALDKIGELTYRARAHGLKKLSATVTIQSAADGKQKLVGPLKLVWTPTSTTSLNAAGKPAPGLHSTTVADIVGNDAIATLKRFHVKKIAKGKIEVRIPQWVKAPVRRMVLSTDRFGRLSSLENYYASGKKAPNGSDDDPDFEHKWWKTNGAHPNWIIPNAPDPINGQQRWMDTVVEVARA